MTRISAFLLLLLCALLLTPSSCHSSRLRRAHARLHRLHHLILQLEALHRDEPFYTEPFYTPMKNVDDNQPIINMENGLTPVQNDNPLMNNWSSPSHASPVINPDNGLAGAAPNGNLFLGNNWSGAGAPGQTSPIGSIQLTSPIDVTNPSTPISTDNWTSNTPIETSPILPIISNIAPFNQPPSKDNILDAIPPSQGEQSGNSLFNGGGNVSDVPSQTIPNDPNSSNIDPLVTESLAAQRTQVLGTFSDAQTPSDLAVQSAAAQQTLGQNTNPATAFISSQESHEALERLAEQQVETEGKGYIV